MVAIAFQPECIEHPGTVSSSPLQAFARRNPFRSSKCRRSPCVRRQCRPCQSPELAVTTFLAYAVGILIGRTLAHPLSIPSMIGVTSIRGSPYSNTHTHPWFHSCCFHFKGFKLRHVTSCQVSSRSSRPPGSRGPPALKKKTKHTPNDMPF